MKKETSKSPPKTAEKDESVKPAEKPLSLNPLKVEEALEGLLKTKPKKVKSS